MAELEAGGCPFLVVTESVTEDGTHDWRQRRDSYPSVGGQGLPGGGSCTCRGTEVCPRGTEDQPAWLEGQCAQGARKGEVNYERNQVMAGPVGGAGNVGLILHFRILAFNLF